MGRPALYDRTNGRIHWIAVLLLTAGMLAPAPARADFQIWNWITVDLGRTETLHAYLYIDHRFSTDPADLDLQIFAPRLNWRAHENLDLGLGWGFLRIRDPLTDDFDEQGRLELEFNPRAEISERLHFANRNRLELRWNNHRGKPRPRSRHRLQLTYDLEAIPEASLFINNEFFFDYDRSQYSENRFVPAGVTLSLCENASLDFFYLIQSQREINGSTWEHSHVFGTFVRIRF